MPPLGVEADTIAAVATPPGRGGIGIVRVSGPAAASIAKHVVGKALPPPRQAAFSRFLDADGSPIDSGIVLFFQSPASFTGEDAVEFQGHGGTVVLDRLLERICSLGARIARPGEFTERAFRNGKIDLAQAEAVADLIDSASRRAARSAMRSLDGEFSARVMDLDRGVLDLRVYLEAAIDFADEEIDFLAEDDVRGRLDRILEAARALLRECRQGQVLRDGLDVVIAGPPNAGKSSLMNKLLAENRAIVTDIPGTTRDLLHADLHVEGIPVRLTDTAGLRSGGDAVEAIGVGRAKAAAAQADLVLFVNDDTSESVACALSEPSAGEREGEPLAQRDLVGVGGRVVGVRNKVDLSGRPPGKGLKGEVFVSALTGAGIDALRQEIVNAAGVAPGEGVFLARERHLAALARVVEHLAAADRQTRLGFGDLAAEELRQAQDALAEVVGARSVEDLLGEIFASFCVGK